MDVRLIINDVEVVAQKGQSLLEVAREAGFSIPSLCHHAALEPIGACRVCLVEIYRGDRPELTTSCDFLVEPNLRVVTDSKLVREHRAMNLDLLLARAPGSMRVRELAAQYGVHQSSFQAPPDTQIPNCILCELCVRVCAQLGHHAINTISRGSAKRIGLPFNKPSEACVGCGSCYSVCPTRCITLKDMDGFRTIWGQRHNFVKCRECQAPIMTEKHRAFAISTKGLSEDYYDRCESCKQLATSQRFKTVVW